MANKEHWYQAKKDEVAHRVGETVAKIDEDQAYRGELNLRNLQSYSNLGILGLGAGDYSDSAAATRSEIINLNVSEAIIDTMKALIGANKPRVRFLTKGGDFESQKKAKNLTDFIGAQFYTNRLYDQNQTVFTCAAAMGTGFYLVDEDGKDIRIEWVFPDDVLVDDVESKYGKPRSLYVHRDVERTVLEEQYPEEAFKIAEAKMVRASHVGSSKLSDPVSLIEAWHLPAGGKPGRHVLCTSSVTFVDEEYNEDVFPVVEFCYARRVLGFFGKSVCEIVRGIQTEINTLLGKIQRLMNLASSKVYLPKGSKVPKAKINNEEGGIIEYAGNVKPEFQIIPAVAPEYYAQVENLYRKAFEIAGVSQAQITGSMQRGLESGAAVREVNDIQTQRFLHVGQAWEEFHLAIADRVLRAGKRLAASNPGYSIVAEDGKKLFEIKWSDVDPGDDKYIMKAWPASLLPESPAGKMEVVQTMLAVEPRLQPYAMALIDNPDIEAALKRINAPTMLMDKIVERILVKGEMLPPEPFMDLEAGIVQMQQAYLSAIVDDIAEPKLALMRQWMVLAQEILASSAAAIPPPTEQAMMPGPEMGAEQMPPAAGGMPGPVPPLM